MPNFSFFLFQLTRLMRGVTRQGTAAAERSARFQLTRLMRGVTVFLAFFGAGRTFQLTRLMRGVTANISAQS